MSPKEVILDDKYPVEDLEAADKVLSKGLPKEEISFKSSKSAPSYLKKRMKGANGFTFIEVIIALVLLSVCLAPLLIMFPTGSKAGQLATLYTRATNLAEDMMEEIKGKAFEDPDGNPVFGPELPGEDARIKYDDVDDYDDWNLAGNPPKDISNNDINGFEDFVRQVDVKYAYLDGNQWEGQDSPPADDRYRMITVTVKHDDMADAVLVTIVANY